MKSKIIVYLFLAPDGDAMWEPYIECVSSSVFCLSSSVCCLDDMRQQTGSVPAKLLVFKAFHDFVAKELCCFVVHDLSVCIIDHMFVLFAPSCSRSKTCLICRCASIRGIWICKASALVCFSSSAGSYAPRVADSVWSIHRNCGNTSREWSPRAEDPPAQDSDN